MSLGIWGCAIGAMIHGDDSCGARVLPVILIDGIRFRDHTILVALGATDDGTKQVLGLREGSTENAAVARAHRSEDSATQWSRSPCRDFE